MGEGLFGSGLGLHLAFGSGWLRVGRILYTCLVCWYAYLAPCVSYGVHEKCSGLAESGRIVLKFFFYYGFKSKGTCFGGEKPHFYKQCL